MAEGDPTALRRLGLRDALKGLGLAFAASALVVIAVIGGIIALLVVTLGPSRGDGPGDGRHSRHLDVVATPARDLQGGTVVRVRASRLVGAGEAIIALCGVEADTRSRGVAACDLDHRSQVPVRHGKISASFGVSRSITVDNGKVLDCASRPGRCVLMVASVENYDRSGFVPIFFLPA